MPMSTKSKRVSTKTPIYSYELRLDDGDYCTGKVGYSPALCLEELIGLGLIEVLYPKVRVHISASDFPGATKFYVKYLMGHIVWAVAPRRSRWRSLYIAAQAAIDKLLCKADRSIVPIWIKITQIRNRKQS